MKPILLTLKVTLQDTRPTIWRRFTVPYRTTFSQLHSIIGTVMGWPEPNESYHFEHEEGIFTSKPIGPETKDASEWTVDMILRQEGRKLTYHCGFEEDWEHEVLLEKITFPTHSQLRVLCLAGERNCPPSDCGGPLGFGELLRALASRNKSKTPGQFRGWVEGPFNPDAFKISTVNAALNRLKLRKGKVRAPGV
jgi:hypothetical protein